VSTFGRNDDFWVRGEESGQKQQQRQMQMRGFFASLRMTAATYLSIQQQLLTAATYHLYIRFCLFASNNLSCCFWVNRTSLGLIDICPLSGSDPASTSPFRRTWFVEFSYQPSLQSSQESTWSLVVVAGRRRLQMLGFPI
jgi:hypothetical protein